MGTGNIAIAMSLHHHGTVKTQYVRKILEKLCVEDRTQVITGHLSGLQNGRNEWVQASLFSQPAETEGEIEMILRAKWR